MDYIYKRVIVTGGAGFIGGNLIRKLLLDSEIKVLNIDKLSYASDLSSINSIKYHPKRYKHIILDLKNKLKIESIVNDFRPDLIIHLAAESHVDRSLEDPSIFIESNIIGTFNLVQSSYIYWKGLSPIKKNIFKFIHVSTDEVFGSLGEKGYFSEGSKYFPSSPYSASKASSDHIVNAWYQSYDFPAIVSNCSNNYGPYQFPEKLIPHTILNCLKSSPIPLYGQGNNIRDWLFVEDHINALILISQKGKIGENYCIGGNSERTNLQVVNEICIILDNLLNEEFSFAKLIKFVKDRPGHDKRYAINSAKIKNELGWEPKYKFKDGIEKTVKWYVTNQKWLNEIIKRSNYKGKRLGL